MANEMENNSPNIKAPATVPGNFKGTLAGLIAGVATAALAKTGVYAIAAEWLGQNAIAAKILALALSTQGIAITGTQPEILIASACALIVGSAVNYGVTHFSGIRTCADLYAALPETYAEYPETKKLSGTSKTNLKDNRGNPVNSGA